MTSPPMPASQQTKEDTDEVHDHLERTFAGIAHRVRECPSGFWRSSLNGRRPATSRSGCSSYEWGTGAGIVQSEEDFAQIATVEPRLIEDGGHGATAPLPNLRGYTTPQLRTSS